MKRKKRRDIQFASSLAFSCFSSFNCSKALASCCKSVSFSSFKTFSSMYFLSALDRFVSLSLIMKLTERKNIERGERNKRGIEE